MVFKSLLPNAGHQIGEGAGGWRPKCKRESRCACACRDLLRVGRTAYSGALASIVARPPWLWAGSEDGTRASGEVVDNASRESVQSLCIPPRRQSGDTVAAKFAGKRGLSHRVGLRVVAHANPVFPLHLSGVTQIVVRG